MGEIFIVDETFSANRLAHYFNRNGYAACVGSSSEACYQSLDRRQICVLIVADRLGEVDGFEICRQVRARAHIPIIMLVPAGDKTGKVLALELGADDCLTKPISFDELLARILAVRRRYRTVVPFDNDQLEIGGLRVELTTGRATIDGVERQLTRAQCVLLQVLIRNAGNVIRRDELRDHLRASGTPATERSIDVHICRLRSLIELDPHRPSRIMTVRRMGYSFVSPITLNPGAQGDRMCVEP